MLKFHLTLGSSRLETGMREEINTNEGHPLHSKPAATAGFSPGLHRNTSACGYIAFRRPGKQGRTMNGNPKISGMEKREHALKKRRNGGEQERGLAQWSGWSSTKKKV